MGISILIFALECLKCDSDGKQKKYQYQCGKYRCVCVIIFMTVACLRKTLTAVSAKDEE